MKKKIGRPKIAKADKVVPFGFTIDPRLKRTIYLNQGTNSLADHMEAIIVAGLYSLFKVPKLSPRRQS